MTTAEQLDALIEELTVDAYNDEEQLSGFLVGADEALVRGEHATIAGVTVEVISVDCGPDARTGLTARVLLSSDARRPRCSVNSLSSWSATLPIPDLTGVRTMWVQT